VRVDELEAFDPFQRGGLDRAGEALVEAVLAIERVEQAVAFHAHADLTGEVVQGVLLRAFLKVRPRLGAGADADVVRVGDRSRRGPGRLRGNRGRRRNIRGGLPALAR